MSYILLVLVKYSLGCNEIHLQFLVYNVHILLVDAKLTHSNDTFFFFLKPVNVAEAACGEKGWIIQFFKKKFTLFPVFTRSFFTSVTMHLTKVCLKY